MVCLVLVWEGIEGQGGETHLEQLKAAKNWKGALTRMAHQRLSLVLVKSRGAETSKVLLKCLAEPTHWALAKRRENQIRTEPQRRLAGTTHWAFVKQREKQKPTEPQRRLDELIHWALVKMTTEPNKCLAERRW